MGGGMSINYGVDILGWGAAYLGIPGLVKRTHWVNWAMLPFNISTGRGQYLDTLE